MQPRASRRAAPGAPVARRRAPSGAAEDAEDQRHRGGDARDRSQQRAARQGAASRGGTRGSNRPSNAATRGARWCSSRSDATTTSSTWFAGADRDRAERHRMRVAEAAIVHGDAEETGRAVRLARRLDLLEMPAQRLFPLVDAMDRLESQRRGGGERRGLVGVGREGVERRLTMTPLVGEVQEPTALVLRQAIELVQQRRHVGAGERRDLLGAPAVDARQLEEQARRARRPCVVWGAGVASGAPDGDRRAAPTRRRSRGRDTRARSVRRASATPESRSTAREAPRPARDPAAPPPAGSCPPIRGARATWRRGTAPIRPRRRRARRATRAPRRGHPHHARARRASAGATARRRVRHRRRVGTPRRTSRARAPASASTRRPDRGRQRTSG